MMKTLPVIFWPSVYTYCHQFAWIGYLVMPSSESHPTIHADADHGVCYRYKMHPLVAGESCTRSTWGLTGIGAPDGE